MEKSTSDQPARKKSRMQDRKSSGGLQEGTVSNGSPKNQGLVLGAQVLVKKNDPTNIADCIGHIVDVPNHPNTWYQVKMQDGSIGKYRPSHLEVAHERTEQTLAQLTQIGNKSPQLNGAIAVKPKVSKTKGENGKRSRGDGVSTSAGPQTSKEREVDFLVPGSTVEIVETNNVRGRVPHLVGSFGIIESTPEHPNTWYKVSFEHEERPVKFQATALKYSRLDAAQANARRIKQGGNRPRTYSAASDGSRSGTLAKLKNERVLIVEGTGKGLNGTIVGGGNGYFWVLTNRGEFRKRRPHFKLKGKSVNGKRKNRSSANSFDNQSGDADVSSQETVLMDPLNKRVRVLATQQLGMVIESPDSGEYTVELDGTGQTINLRREEFELLNKMGKPTRTRKPSTRKRLNSISSVNEFAAEAAPTRQSTKTAANVSTNRQVVKRDPTQDHSFEYYHHIHLTQSFNAPLQEDSKERTLMEQRRQRRIARKRRIARRTDKSRNTDAPNSKLGKIIQERQDHMVMYLSRIRDAATAAHKYRPNVGHYEELVQGDEHDEDEDDYRGMVPKLAYCTSCFVEKDYQSDSCWNPACTKCPIYDPNLRPLSIRVKKDYLEKSGTNQTFAVPASPRRSNFIDVPEQVPDPDDDGNVYDGSRMAPAPFFPSRFTFGKKFEDRQAIQSILSFRHPKEKILWLRGKSEIIPNLANTKLSEGKLAEESKDSNGVASREAISAKAETEVKAGSQNGSDSGSTNNEGNDGYFDIDPTATTENIFTQSDSELQDGEICPDNYVLPFEENANGVLKEVNNGTKSDDKVAATPKLKKKKEETEDCKQKSNADSTVQPEHCSNFPKDPLSYRWASLLPSIESS